MTKPPPSFFSATLFALVTPDEARQYIVERSAPCVEVDAQFAALAPALAEALYWRRYEHIKPER